MTKNKRAEPRGQSLVEVALTFPILVMLMLGLLDFGRAYYALVTLNDAAAEGAAYAATAQNVNDIEARVRAAEATSLVPMDTVTVQISPGPYAIAAGVTVTVTYQMPIFTPFVNTLVGSDSLTLRADATQPVISLGN